MCPNCNEELAVTRNKILSDEIVRVLVSCPKCHKARLREAIPDDGKRLRQLSRQLEENLRKNATHVPDDPYPDGNMARENAVFQRGVRFFRDLFTKRNLSANVLLKKAILAAKCTDATRDALTLTFSASLRFTNTMVFRNPGWQGGKPIEWAKAAYWLPDVYNELNVLFAFRNRQKAILRGLKYANAELPKDRIEAHSLGELRQNGSHWMITGSSDGLPLPSESVDTIITDPPVRRQY